MNTKTLIVASTIILCNLVYAALNFDASKSTVSITLKQMNSPITGKFKKLQGTIDYNPSTPEATKVNIEIDIPSFDIGGAEYNAETMKKEWFNAAQFPKATFVSTSMKNTGNGKFLTAGDLTIKGKTVQVEFPVSVSKEGKSTVFDGVLPIKRLDFTIGEGKWKETKTIADEVIIKFHVVAQ